jgi:transcriptional regulator with XRE-family HTH domain
MDKENIKRGAFLKEVRTANLLSEEELAELLGVETSDITVWETGIKFPEDNGTLDELSRILKVSKKELQNGEFKKDKTSPASMEVEYEELSNDEPSSIVLSNSGKNILLIVLSCLVLFILVVTIASIAGGKKTYVPVNKEHVSDEREVIHHEPHRSNEYIIYNTQVLSANDSSHYDGSKLVKYGFVQSGDKYIKSTNKYKIEYYNSTFYLTIYYKSGNLYITRDAKQSLMKYTDSNRAKEVTVEMAPPSGEVDCDVDICTSNNDYYKYLNLLVKAVRG